MNDEVNEKVYPTIRIYLNVHTEDHDQCSVEEFLEMCGEKGIAEFIRELIDEGICNVYYCCFDNVMKVL